MYKKLSGFYVDLGKEVVKNVPKQFTPQELKIFPTRQANIIYLCTVKQVVINSYVFC